MFTRVNEKLYAQLERISDSSISKAELAEEVERSKAMALLASQMIAAETLEMRKEIVNKQLQMKKVAGYIE